MTRPLFVPALLLALAAPAAAEQATPRLELSSQSLDLPAGGGEAELRLKNRGGAPLVVQNVRVAEGSTGFAVEALQKTLQPEEEASVKGLGSWRFGPSPGDGGVLAWGASSWGPGDANLVAALFLSPEQLGIGGLDETRGRDIGRRLLKRGANADGHPGGNR